MTNQYITMKTKRKEIFSSMALSLSLCDDNFTETEKEIP